jgi:hypothetical protein
MRTLKLIATTALTAALGLGAASANVQLSQQGSSVFGSPNWSKNVTITVDGQNSRVAAGLFRLTDSIDDVLALCIEPDSPLRLSETYSTTDQSGDWINSLAEITSLFETSFDQVVDAQTAAGFQIALWEVIVEDDNNYDLGSGAFSVTGGSGVLAAANAFLAAIGGPATQQYSFTTFANSGQDLISADAVPVPAAAFLFAPALAGLAMRKRRKA